MIVARQFAIALKETRTVISVWGPWAYGTLTSYFCVYDLQLCTGFQAPDFFL